MQGRNQLMGRWYPLPPLWLEGRAGLEYARLRRSPIYNGVGVRQGEGRPVMLIPGFLAGDRSLDVMRAWLRRNGYRPLRSGINLNIESSEILVQRLSLRLAAEYRRNGRRVILVGQSRGGVLAFGVAGRFPEFVESVVALGSPLADPMDVHPSTMAAVHVARFMHAVRRGPRDLDARFDQELANPVSVPVTSLYSLSDGVVHGEACIRPDVDSIEVGGSHVGMGVSPKVYKEIARVLGEEAPALKVRPPARFLKGDAMNDRAALVARYREGPDVLEAVVAGLTEDQLDTRPADGGWTPREIVHHTADSEMTSAIRLRRLLAEDNPEILGYDQDAFAKRLHYSRRPMAASLAAVRAARESSASILDHLSEADWARSGTHSEVGEYSVETWLRVYAAHCHDHAEQVRRVVTG